MINVTIDNIQDDATKTAIRNITEQLNKMPILRGTWKFIEIEVTSAVTSRSYPHTLGFKPKDVIEISRTNGATVTWKFDDFTKDYIVVTTSGATTIRAFIGSYQEA